MAEEVQVAERAEQKAASADDAAASNGSPGPSFALPAALTLGGAVVGAVAAVLGRRRVQELAPADDDRPELTNELASRASAAARGEDDDPDAEGDDRTEAAQPLASGEADDELDNDEPDDDGQAPATGEAEAADEPTAREARFDAEDESPPERDEEASPPGPEPVGEAGDDDGDGEAGEDDDGAPGGSATGVARAAARQLQELTGRAPEGILGVERDGDGWRVTLELVELSRIPSTTDVLGRYEVEIDGDGEVTEYRQVSRYVRGRGGGDRG